MLNEFKAFIVKGNVMDLAVGVIIGGAFGKIVKSLVNDILMPPIGKMMGGMDFKSMYINLSDETYETMDAAMEAGAPIIKHGMFIQNIIDFVIIALCIFMMVKAINSAKKKEEEKPAAPPAPSKEEVLLTEIRDLLKK